MRTRPRRFQAAWASALLLVTALTAPACGGGQQAIVEQSVAFQTSVAPRAGEDLAAACKYEITLMNPSRPVQGVWVIFERSLGTLRYYQDADVRAFARRHDLALLFPFHCRSKSETRGDMNVDPSKGIGRAVFSALTQLAKSSSHPELASANLILLGFSGTGSLSHGSPGLRRTGSSRSFLPTRDISTRLGMDTINLPLEAQAIPQLILVGSADAVSGTERPYAYFRRHFDQGAPWTFVVQNKVPHCCIMNAKDLILGWLEAVVVQRATRATGSYGFVETRPSEATYCPGQSPPVRASWCRSTTDTWGGENWSVATATVEGRSNPPQGMLPAGWLPTDAFAKQWVGFVTRPVHPVTLPP